jgi:hypothetical protein
MTMLTRAEQEEAIAGGDHVCICGYRKSLHEDGTHPAIDPHTKQCNNGRFNESHFHTRMADPDGMFEGKKRGRR